MSENELKQAVIKAARMYGWLVQHTPQRKMRSAGDHGYPDLTIARDRQVIWLELKTLKGIVSNAQRRWIDELPNVYVVRESDLYDGTLARILG